MRMCDTHVTSVYSKLPILHCALDTVTALCTTVTLLSVALTVDTRPTAESGDESGDGSDPDKAPAVCTDHCSRCLNFTTHHLGTPHYQHHHPMQRAQQQALGAFVHAPPPLPNGNAQAGSGQFSERGAQRLPEMASTPCLQHLLGHVTLLQEEMERLDSRMDAVLDSIGQQERS